MADRQINLRINIAIKQSEAALKILNDRIALLQKQLSGGNLSDKDIKRINAEIMSTQNSVNSLTKSVNTLDKSMSGLNATGQKTGNMFINITRYFTSFLLVQQVSKAIRSIAENYVTFSNVLSTNRALMRGSKEDLEALKVSALELSKQSKFTAIEIANLQTNLIKLGVEGVANIDILTKSIMDLAAASDEDLAKSGDILYSIINQFGLAASDATEVVNIMTDAFVKSASDLDSFANSMKYVGSSAHQLGLNLRETSSLIALISNLNIKGSSAGTSLNNLLMEMAKNSSNLNKTFGVEIKGFKDVIAVLEKLQGLDTSSIMSIMNIRSTKAALPFKDADLLNQLKVLSGQLDETGKRATEFGYTISKALGGDSLNTAANMARKQMDSVAGDLKKLQANATALGLELTNSMDSPIRNLVQSLNKGVNSIRDFFGFIEKNWSKVVVGLKLVIYYFESMAILWTTNKLSLFFENAAKSLMLFNKALLINYRQMIAYKEANLVTGQSLNILQKGLTGVGAAMKTMGASNPFGLMLIAALAIEKIFKNLPSNVKKAEEQAAQLATSDAINSTIPKAAKSAQQMPAVTLRGEQLVNDISNLPARGMDKAFKKQLDDEKTAIQGVISSLRDQQQTLIDAAELRLVKEKEFMELAQETADLQKKVDEGKLKWTDTIGKGSETAAQKVEGLNKKMLEMYDIETVKMVNGTQLVNRNLKEIFQGGGGLEQAWWFGDWSKIRKKDAPFDFPPGAKDMLVNGKQNIDKLTDLYNRLNVAEDDFGKKLKDSREELGLTMEEINKQSYLKELQHRSRMAEILLAGDKDNFDYVENVRATKKKELLYRKELIENSILAESEKETELLKIYEGQAQAETTFVNNSKKRNEVMLQDQQKLFKEQEKDLQYEYENIKKSLENKKMLLDNLSIEGYVGQFEIQVKEMKLLQEELVANADDTYNKLYSDEIINARATMKELADIRDENNKQAYDEAAVRLNDDEVAIQNDKTYKNSLITNEKTYGDAVRSLSQSTNKAIIDANNTRNETILNGQEQLHQKQLENEREFIKDYVKTQLEYEKMLSDLAVQVSPQSVGAKLGQSNTNQKVDIQAVNDKYSEDEKKFGVSGAFDMGLWDKKQKAITDITRKYSLERLEILNQEAAKYVQMFQEMVTQVGDLVATQKEIELQANQDRYDQAIKSAEANQEMLLQEYGLKNKKEEQMTAAQKRKLEKINKQADAAKAKADKKKEEDDLALKKKYAEKEFALKVMNIIGNTAMAISKVWSQWAAYPPVAIGLSIVAGAIGAVQIAQAKKQKDAVQNLEFGGPVVGKSHKQGGVPVELEGDEIVINKKSASIPWVRSLALQLNRVNNPKLPTNGRIMANGGQVRTSPVVQEQIDFRSLVEEVTAGVVNTIQVENNALETVGKSDNVKQVRNRTTW